MSKFEIWKNEISHAAAFSAGGRPPGGALGGDSRQRNDFAVLRASTPSEIAVLGEISACHVTRPQPREPCRTLNFLETNFRVSGCNGRVRNQKCFKLM